MPSVGTLTQPVLPRELAKALPVRFPASEEIHRAVLPALKYLQGEGKVSTGATASGPTAPRLPPFPTGCPQVERMGEDQAFHFPQQLLALGCGAEQDLRSLC